MSIISNVTDLFKPVLSDRTIMKYNAKGLLIENPIVPRQLQPNSVDLTLGTTFKKIKCNLEKYKWESIMGGSYTAHIDPSEKLVYEEGTFTNDHYVLEPGEFVLMASNEVLNIPNGILSFVQGRSSIARLGIQTEQAGLIDAGFRGTITFEVYNQTPHKIILYSGMRIAQVYFFKAQKAINPYGSSGRGGKYYNQIEATESKINRDFELMKYAYKLR